MQSVVIGTAGHIDHGKSALVKALTGIDPDRLKEEQARGITIDLGFAHAAIGGVNVAFVDVPGHERFVRNMLAGAGGIDAVLLVVAADESVKPQTREHLDICRLLNVQRGVIALTKTDLVDAETCDLVALEVRELAEGSFLADAPLVPVSVRTGAGLETLRVALAALAGAPLRQGRAGVVRLPVDRVFSVKGFGTVVTGTLVSGAIAERDELEVAPEGRIVRVRGLQVHGRAASRVGAPSRVAVNLGSVEVGDLARGVTLATAGSLALTRRLDARLHLLASARPLRHGARVRVHHGTSELFGRVSLAAVRSGPHEAWRPVRAGEASVAVPPGGDAFARLRLDRPAALTRLDRVIVRAYSPPVTIAGAVVLDPEPPAVGVRRPSMVERFNALDAVASGPAAVAPRAAAEPASAPDPSTFLAVWLSEAGERGIDLAMLVRRGGLGPGEARELSDALVGAGGAVAAGGRLVDRVVIDRLRAATSSALAEFHAADPRDDGMPREALREQVAPKAPVELFDAVVTDLKTGGVLTGTDRLALAGHRPVRTDDDARVETAVESLLRRAGLTPPDAAGLAAAGDLAPAAVERAIRTLVRQRKVVRLDAIVFHAEALAGLKAKVQALGRDASAGSPAEVDVATFKQRFGLSRKYAIPLLEWLDRERVTRRRGEGRLIL